MSAQWPRQEPTCHVGSLTSPWGSTVVFHWRENPKEKRNSPVLRGPARPHRADEEGPRLHVSHCCLAECLPSRALLRNLFTFERARTRAPKGSCLGEFLFELHFLFGFPKRVKAVAIVNAPASEFMARTSKFSVYTASPPPRVAQSEYFITHP